MVIRPYLQLMRLHQRTGLWLLMWPALLGLWVAHQEFYRSAPDPWLIALIVVGALITRSLGCTLNDILDRDLDGHVARTRERPLPSGTLSLRQALILAGALSLAALTLLLWTNQLTAAVAALAAVLIGLYPLAKRFLRAPQLVLAVTFSMGIPITYAIVLDWLNPVLWWLFAANATWIMAYDTIYAMADAGDDASHGGIHSTALLFGRHAPAAIAVFQTLTIVLLVFYGIDNMLNLPYYLAVTSLYFLFVYQQRLIRGAQPDPIRAFDSNVWGGAILFAGTVLNYVWFV